MSAVPTPSRAAPMPAATTTRAAPTQPPRRAPAAFSDLRDEFRLNLSDIQIARRADALEVDGFKPNLFSRLFRGFAK